MSKLKFYCVILPQLLLFVGLPWRVLGESPAADPAMEVLHTANALYNRGLFGPAREQFDLFLREYGDHGRIQDARMGRALSLVGEGKGEEAVRELRTLSQDRNFDRREDMRAVLANLQLQLQNTREAMREARGLAGDSEEESIRNRARITWSEAAFLLREWPQVIEASRPPLNERMSYQLGYALVQEKGQDTEEAIAPLTGPAESDGPYAHPACLLLAGVYQARGDSENTRKFYHRAAYDATGSESAAAGWQAALLAWRSEDAGAAVQALEAFRDGFAEHAQIPRATLLLGRARENQDDARRAREAYEAAMAFEETRHEAAVRRLRLLERDRYRDPLLEAALGWPADPNWTPILLMDQARHDLENDRTEAAVTRLTQLIAEFEESDLQRNARLELADALEALARHGEAAEASLAFANAFPEDPERDLMRFRAARNLVRAEREAEAADVLKALFDDEPAEEIDPPARMLLARLHTRGERWADVISVLAPRREAADRQGQYLSGMAALRLEQWPNAAQWLGAFVEDAPEDMQAEAGEARLALARALESDDKPAEAIAALRDFLRTRGDDARMPEVKLRLAGLQEDVGALDDARQTLAQISEDHGDHAVAPLALDERVRLALAADEKQQAAVLSEQLARSHRDHERAPAAALRAGTLYMQAEQYEKAAEILREYLRHHEDHAEAGEGRYLRATALLRDEKPGDAEGEFKRFLERHAEHPRRPRALYELAWIQRNRERSDEAIVLYQTLLEEAPEHELTASAKGELADLLRDAGRVEESLAVLEGLADNDPRAAILKARGLMDTGKHAEAAAAFAAAAELQTSPNAVRDAWFQSGEASMRERDYAAALRSFERSRDTAGAEPTPALWLRLSEANGFNGRWGESLKIAEEFLARFPEDPLYPRALYQAGWALENQGESEKAIERYRALVNRGEKTAVTARAQFQIGECLVRLERTDAAIAAFTQVLLVYDFPEVSAPALLQLAESLRRSGNEEEAKARYRELIETYPDSSAAALAREQIPSE
ncbi:MAG: tetratricopeptide repeat protein [Verrucomicrobia bacterium]|nr:tetratricopeptide repeat protein [Verrucomicrobiota bacterium]